MINAGVKTMLDTNLQAQLQQYLALLESPIELTLSLDSTDAAGEMKTLLEEIAALSDKISLHTASDNRAPSFTIGKAGDTSKSNEAARIRFAGIPLGHEFTSLVLALLQTSGRAPKLSDEHIAQIKALDVDAVFETYISLSCQICPEVVQALNVMAVLNPRISHTMIDGALFQEEVSERQIMA